MINTTIQPIAFVLILFLVPDNIVAQKENALIKKGNEAYNKKQYEVARDEYRKASEKNPANQKAQFNLGNALYKTEKPDDAVLAYDAAIQNSKLPGDRSGAFYNKGVVLQNNKKLPECIDAYKNSLRLNPGDEDARLNLQKALQQQKQQQQKEKEQKEQKKPTDDPKKKDPGKNEKNDKQNDLPKPQPSKMTKKEAEEKLKALLQQEKRLQDKLKKVNAASPEKPEKDW